VDLSTGMDLSANADFSANTDMNNNLEGEGHDTLTISAQKAVISKFFRSMSALDAGSVNRLLQWLEVE